MSVPRIIKRYANRRLYDIESSRYVTLATLQSFVLRRSDFVVQDGVTGRDITDRVLLQVLARFYRKKRGGRAFLLKAIRAGRKS